MSNNKHPFKDLPIVVNDMVWLEPKSCKHCDWEPPLINNPKQEIAVDNTWLVLPLPNSAIWFYVCPKCSAVWANRNSVENVKKLLKTKESKILTLDSKSRIAKPNILMN